MCFPRSPNRPRPTIRRLGRHPRGGLQESNAHARQAQVTSNSAWGFGAWAWRWKSPWTRPSFRTGCSFGGQRRQRQHGWLQPGIGDVLFDFAEGEVKRYNATALKRSSGSTTWVSTSPPPTAATTLKSRSTGTWPASTATPCVGSGGHDARRGAPRQPRIDAPQRDRAGVHAHSVGACRGHPTAHDVVERQPPHGPHWRSRGDGPHGGGHPARRHRPQRSGRRVGALREVFVGVVVARHHLERGQGRLRPHGRQHLPLGRGLPGRVPELPRGRGHRGFVRQAHALHLVPLKCCGGATNEAKRQAEADEFMAFHRDAMQPGGELTLPEGSPSSLVAT